MQFCNTVQVLLVSNIKHNFVSFDGKSLVRSKIYHKFCKVSLSLPHILFSQNGYQLARSPLSFVLILIVFCNGLLWIVFSAKRLTNLKSDSKYMIRSQMIYKFVCQIVILSVSVHSQNGCQPRNCHVLKRSFPLSFSGLFLL